MGLKALPVAFKGAEQDGIRGANGAVPAEDDQVPRAAKPWMASEALSNQPLEAIAVDGTARASA
jgi:hypothetical protein